MITHARRCILYSFEQNAVVGLQIGTANLVPTCYMNYSSTQNCAVSMVAKH